MLVKGLERGHQGSAHAKILLMFCQNIAILSRRPPNTYLRALAREHENDFRSSLGNVDALSLAQVILDFTSAPTGGDESALEGHAPSGESVAEVPQRRGTADCC